MSGWAMKCSVLIMSSMLACLPGRSGESSAPDRRTGYFLAIERFDAFERDPQADHVALTSPWYSAPMNWDELVPSWNASCPTSAWMRVQLRAACEDVTTPFYDLGRWTTGTASGQRTSVPGQKDSWAEVKTDTLVFARPMRRAQFRIELRGLLPLPALSFLGLSFSDSRASHSALTPHRKAWGRIIEVPQRSQLGHPGASGWCSPTAVSMLLAHWGVVLNRPELDIPVPEVARGVHDLAWEGTGNWAFNMAYAGQFPGLRAYVTRVAGLRVIEQLVAGGIPVAASVSFDLLNGKPRDEGTGHLIVVAGFTPEGDVAANDPWPNPKGENSVRRIFPRENFLKAWQRSRQTIYLVHPADATPFVLSLIQ